MSEGDSNSRSGPYSGPQPVTGIGATTRPARAQHEAGRYGGRRIKTTASPKRIIEALSEDLLRRFADLPLLDRYDIYQRLMDYWAETMRDDVHLIAADGWTEATKPRGTNEDGGRVKEAPDLALGRRKYKMDLLPPALIIAHFFANEQTGVERLQAKQAAAAGELEEFVEEHRGEGEPLEDAVNDKGKVSKAGVRERLKTIHDDPESGDERRALKLCLAMLDAEADAGKAVKQAQAALDEQVLARYAALTEAEIKTLAVEEKWFASIREAVDGEVQRLTLALVGRIKELDERYARPLPELEREVEAFSGKVAGHLEKMGLSP